MPVDSVRSYMLRTSRRQQRHETCAFTRNAAVFVYPDGRKHARIHKRTEEFYQDLTPRQVDCRVASAIPCTSLAISLKYLVFHGNFANSRARGSTHTRHLTRDEGEKIASEMVVNPLRSGRRVIDLSISQIKDTKATRAIEPLYIDTTRCGIAGRKLFQASCGQSIVSNQTRVPLLLSGRRRLLHLRSNKCDF